MRYESRLRHSWAAARIYYEEETQPLDCMLERMYSITLWHAWETLAQEADALQVVAVHMYVSFVTYF